MNICNTELVKILFYGLLPETEMTDPNKYCSKTDQLKIAIDKKHSEFVRIKAVILYQWNAIMQISLVVKLAFIYFTYSLYLLDITHMDYHLYRFLYNSLNKNNFNILEVCKRQREHFFVQKDKFLRGWNYEVGIM